MKPGSDSKQWPQRPCSVCKSCPGLTKAGGKFSCEPSHTDWVAAKFGSKSAFLGSLGKSDEACPARVWSPLQNALTLCVLQNLTVLKEELALKLSGTNL